MPEQRNPAEGGSEALDDGEKKVMVALLVCSFVGQNRRELRLCQRS
jgi:hypothetical protein